MVQAQFEETTNPWAFATETGATYHARWDKVGDTVRVRMRNFEIVGSGDISLEEKLHELRTLPGTDVPSEQRRQILERRLLYGGENVPRAFADVMTNEAINEEVSDFLRQQVAAVVQDPGTAEILTPRGYAYGTTRITVGTDYYETYNRDNVEAIDAKSTPVERFTDKGVVVGGKEIELEVVICATGFDALTGALTALDIRGTDGQAIKDAWADNCDTYLGFGIAGFPNLLTIGGPGSPLCRSTSCSPTIFRSSGLAGCWTPCGPTATTASRSSHTPSSVGRRRSRM